MMNRGLLVFVLAVGLAAWAAPTVHAAAIKSVQTGTVSMSTATQTATLSPSVDPAKSFVVCSHRTDDSSADNRVTCELTDSTTVTIKNGSSNSAEDVRWSVAEFESGVTVQRGLRSFPSSGSPGDKTQNVTLSPAVDLSKSFVLISERSTSSSTSNDERWTVRAQLTSTTNLELYRDESGTALDVAWQVIQMDGASVQRGTTSYASAATSKTVTLGTAVDLSKSFLVMSRYAIAAIAGVDGKHQSRGTITNATTLTFDRFTGSSCTNGISWEVVTLDDGTGVQSSTTSTASTGTTTMNATLSTIDTTLSVPFITASGGSSSGTSTLDETSWTARLSSSTNLELRRDGSGTNSSVAWFVVTFCGALTDVDYAAATAQNGQVKLYWSSPTPVIILRKSTPFAGEAPANGTSYVVNDAIGAATVVYNGSVAETSFTNTGLTNGTTYYYKIIKKSGSTATCYAPGTVVNASPTASTHPAWSYMMAGGSMLKPGIAGTGAIYTASNASRIVSLSTTDGTQSWAPVATTSAVQGWLTWIPISGGGSSAVIGGDQGGKVYSVNTATGATNWSVTLSGADAVQAATSAQLRVYADATFQATYTTDVIFAATRNASTTTNKLFALRASDGAVLWTFNGTGSSSVDYAVGQPYVDYERNRVYLATRAGSSGTQASLWVINSLNGALVASFPLGHLETSPTLSYSGATLWVGNTSGDLYAINPATLAQKWTSPAALGSAVKGFVWEDLTTAGRLYFTTADGNVWCLQDPGAGPPPNPASPVWKTAVAGASMPLVLSALYVGSTDGKVHELNLITGVDAKQFTLAGTVGDLSTEDSTQIFAGTSAGTIYKLPLPLP